SGIRSGGPAKRFPVVVTAQLSPLAARPVGKRSILERRPIRSWRRFMIAVPCPSCASPVMSDARMRFPPWCPKCGANFKPPSDEATAPAPADAPAAAGPAGPATAPPVARQPAVAYTVQPEAPVRRRLPVRLWVGAAIVLCGVIPVLSPGVVPTLIGVVGGVGCLFVARN